MKAGKPLTPAAIKVLMLGWEYPPLLAGGLGKASYGIANALGHKADLRLVLPRTTRKTSLEKGKILDTSQTLSLHSPPVQLQRKTSRRQKLQIRYVETSLLPYPDAYQSIGHTQSQQITIETSEKEGLPLPPVASGAELLYGPDIMDKIAAYAQTVTENIAAGTAFDIVHAHDWMTFPAAMQLKARYRKPVALHVHSLETDRSGPQARNKVFEIEKAAMQAADLVFAVSGYTRDCILQHYRIDASKIFVVYNGVDEDAPLPQASKPQGKIKEKKVLFLGRVTRQKGPTYLIETAIQVLKRLPKVKFVVAGTGDSLRELMLYAKKREVFNSFEFTGFASPGQVAQLLAGADVYFMPSVSEPFGLAGLEAAQASVPVVVSKQSGLGEVLPGALQADYWDTVTFSDYLYKLLTDPAWHQQKVALNDKQLKRITWARAAEDIIFHFEKLLGNTVEILRQET